MGAAQALANSPWGTGALVEKVLGGGGGITPPVSTSAVTAPPPAPPQGPNRDVIGILNAGNRMFGLGELPQTLAPPRLPAQPGSVPPPSTPATIPLQGKGSIKGAKAVNIAHAALGIPYVWGGESTKGFDCSGLLQYAWKRVGVAIPRTTYDQWKVGTPVAANQLQSGDAVFFKGSDSKNGLPGHVGIYIGDGKFIEAPHTGANVRISNLAGRTDYMGARRYS